MKKVVIAIALMLAASASWAGGTLTAAATVFGATLGTTKTAYARLYTASYSLRANDVQSGGRTKVYNQTVNGYLIDLGTSNERSSLAKEFVSLYEAGTLHLGVGNDGTVGGWNKLSYGDDGKVKCEHMGSAYKFTLETNSSGIISKDGYATSRDFFSGSLESDHYYAVVIFTENNSAFDITGNGGFYATGDNTLGNGNYMSFRVGYNTEGGSTISSAIPDGGSNGGNGGWYVPIATTAHATLGVPEPTSGLMILIGIASLALKRKRA